MSAIMSQNGRKMAKMLHSASKKFDWVGQVLNVFLNTKRKATPTLQEKVNWDDKKNSQT